MSRYRSRLQIVADILSVANEGARKTRIMYRVRLSHKMLTQYLDELLKANLLEYDGESYYQLTDQGKRFLRLYKTLRQLIA